MNLIVVSNRGPLKVGPHGEFHRSSGGLATALDPLLRARGGTWIWQEDATISERARESSQLPPYACRFVDIPETVRTGFYEGFANGVLWPLMHSFPMTTTIGGAPWDDYQAANEIFAARAREAVDAADGTAAVWIHDYQLCLTPGMLREMRPESRIGWFCHIPWPSPDMFEILPWRSELLDGLLGADQIGFHTARYADAFLESVRRITGAEVDHGRRTIWWRGRRVRVVVAPIGIDVDHFRRLAENEAQEARVDELKALVGGRRIILSVDRLDYTKGIIERLEGYERWLRLNPGREDEVALVQIMVPSRTGVPAYAALKEEVDQVVGRVNGRFGRMGQAAVHYLYRAVERPELVAHYRAADVALVTPLRDGMNLVAHEYVACRSDKPGALVLSEFAGAAQHLDGAILVNPYSPQSLAEALDEALAMAPEEGTRRMTSLGRGVTRLNVHDWAERFLAELRDAPATSPTRSGVVSVAQ